MKALIVDDEEPARREMRHLLAAHAHVTVVGEAADVRSALSLTELYRPDVVFLDVQLVGETGFDYLSQLPENGPQVIFVTAHARFAVRGFDCNALDYLLKPVEPKRLAEALRRPGQRVIARPRVPLEESVLIKSGDRTRLAPWRQVDHITSEGNYTQVRLADGEVLLVLRPLREWLEMCPSGQFVQIHRGTIVRIAAIRELRSLGEKRHGVVLNGGGELSVGRQYLEALRIAAGFR